MNTSNSTAPRTLPGIGTLVNQGLYWQLTYEQCRHTLDIVTWKDLEDCVRTHHGTCLECKPVALQRHDG